MAGNAVTSAFMLSEATVMIGPQNKLFELNPAQNSIGLVKNFSITAEPTYTELTQGIRNHLIYSVMTENKVKATMEVFEYTSANLAYGLGLDGSTLSSLTSDNYTLLAAITGDGTTTNTATIHSSSDISSSFVPGSWMFIQELGGTDAVHVTRVVSATYASTTLTVVMTDPVPAGMVLDIGSTISPVNQIPVGKKTDQPFFSAKIVGIMPNLEPLIVLIPKIRIIKGFTVMFSNGGQNQFGNLPFEFEPYELLPADPNYSLYANQGFASVLTRQ